ncbi:hypothetical protein BN12_530030 [Nostocoides japonicum T1-X7]|uniref:Uncharacterized protein n=1 Tax=Nostocoides japonicum T1-X7 TaxID=1194083 RepID=A0A077M1I7_9MICO|nr:hypothetical protein BN12_530030 [Tetrasphaera japonica T1-X7]
MRMFRACLAVRQDCWEAVDWLSICTVPLMVKVTLRDTGSQSDWEPRIGNVAASRLVVSKMWGKCFVTISFVALILVIGASFIVSDSMQALIILSGLILVLAVGTLWFAFTVKALSSAQEYLQEIGIYDSSLSSRAFRTPGTFDAWLAQRDCGKPSR